MSLYEISPPYPGRSYTAPFEDYGLGAEEKSTAPIAIPKTTTDVVMKKDEKIDWMAYLSPVVAGVVMAIMSYGVARGFEVDKSKAVKLAVTMGGVTALGHGLSNWLFKHTEPIRKQLPGAAGTIPAGKSAVAQIPASTTK
jgi:hypothetical protein